MREKLFADIKPGDFIKGPWQIDAIILPAKDKSGNFLIFYNGLVTTQDMYAVWNTSIRIPAESAELEAEIIQACKHLPSGPLYC